MATGVQAGRVARADGPLAVEIRAMAKADGRRGGCGIAAPQRRLPISGTLFALDDALIGLVLDAGAYEALAQLAEEQSALRRVATFVASDPEPEALFRVVAEEAGRRCTRSARRRSATRASSRSPSAAGRTTTWAASRSAPWCRSPTATG